MLRNILILAIGVGLWAQNAPIVETQWRLKQILGEPYTPGKGQKKPYFTLKLKSNQVIGFGGCNRLVGTYKVTGEKLEFTHVAETKVACPAGMDVETKFTQMLPLVATWKIAGQGLDLFDSTKRNLGHFEAVAEKEKEVEVEKVKKK